MAYFWSNLFKVVVIIPEDFISEVIWQFINDFNLKLSVELHFSFSND
jgi:hypothetical protein